MADTLEERKAEENDFDTFNPEFATELSNKLEQMSPRNSNMDLYEERLHEMTASYSEISFDSQNSGSPGSSELDFAGKRGIAGPSERPDKLDLNTGLQDLHLEGTVTKEGDMVSFVTEDLETKIKLSSPVSKKGDTPPFPGSRISTPCLYRQALMPQLPIIDPNVLNDLEMEIKEWALQHRGVTLSKQTQVQEWVIDPERAEMKQYLAVKKVLVDEGAKDGEVQVIQIKTVDEDEQKFPVARLKKGATEMTTLDLMFSMCPVEFKLIKGNGPVHIVGNHILELEKGLVGADTDTELEEEEGETGLEEEEEEEEEVEAATKKRKMNESEQSEEGGKADKKKKEPAAAKGKKGKSPGKSPPTKRKK